jgi:hypothetical protein
MKTNTVSYEPVGNKTANKADSLLAEAENADRFKTIYSAREAFDISDASAIEQKLDSWFFRADATTKAKVGAKAKANKSGKTLTCTPGKTFPCGAVCRAMGKPCKQPMSPEVQEMAKQVATKIKTPTAATTATTATTKPTATTSPSTGTKSGKVTAQKLAEEIEAKKALEPETGKKPANSSKLLPKIILTKQIDPPTEEFDEKDLRAAAESFLELGGFLEPPIVKRTGDELNRRYEVISGHFQVAAGIAARAIDPRRGEAMSAIVIEEENEAAITKQMKAHKSSKQESPKMSGYSQRQIQEIAKELKGEKPNLIPVYVKLLDPTTTVVRSQRQVNELDKLEEAKNQHLFKVNEFESYETSGQVFRGVTKFIKNKEDKPGAEYQYEAVLNGHILEASRLAKNNFIKIMIINEEMEKQLKAETGN